MGRRNTSDSRPQHEDPGLQPERTSLAWGRTLLAFVTAGAIFLRWMQHHGPFTLTLFALCLAAAAAIYMTQHQRYHRAVRGIATEHLHVDPVGVMVLAAVVLLLGALGLYVVLFLSAGG